MVTAAPQLTRIGIVTVLACLVVALFTAAPAQASIANDWYDRDQLVDGTNDYRQQNSLPRLRQHPVLNDVAQAWAEHMVALYEQTKNLDSSFFHNPHRAAQVASVVANDGGLSSGENIAYNKGYADPEGQMITQWINSPGHRTNMLQADWTHLGIGLARDSTGGYWGVQVFVDGGNPAALAAPGELNVTVNLPSGASGTGGCVEVVQNTGGGTWVRVDGACKNQGSNAHTFHFSDLAPGAYSVRAHQFEPGVVLYLGGTVTPSTTVNVQSGSTASAVLSSAAPGDLRISLTNGGAITSGPATIRLQQASSPYGWVTSAESVAFSGGVASKTYSTYVGKRMLVYVTGTGLSGWYYPGVSCRQNAVPVTASTVGGTTTVTGTVNAPIPCLTDITQASSFQEEIIWLAMSGVTTGYADGTFRPGDSVSRQAMAAFLYRLAGSPSFTPPAVSPFTDVPTSSPFYKEVTWLASTGISTGYDDNTFRPAAPVSRQAMAAFLYRLKDPAGYTPPASASFADVPKGSQFYTEVQWLVAQGVTTGYDDGGFHPSASVTRRAMAAFIYRLES